MTPKLYKTDLSPPVRAVLLCAKHIGLDLELIDIDLVAKAEQYQPHFLKVSTYIIKHFCIFFIELTNSYIN